jgi:hypothetical protein
MEIDYVSNDKLSAERDKNSSAPLCDVANGIR